MDLVVSAGRVSDKVEGEAPLDKNEFPAAEKTELRRGALSLRLRVRPHERRRFIGSEQVAREVVVFVDSLAHASLSTP